MPDAELEFFTFVAEGRKHGCLWHKWTVLVLRMQVDPLWLLDSLTFQEDLNWGCDTDNTKVSVGTGVTLPYTKAG